MDINIFLALQYAAQSTRHLLRHGVFLTIIPSIEFILPNPWFCSLSPRRSTVPVFFFKMAAFLTEEEKIPIVSVCLSLGVA